MPRDHKMAQGVEVEGRGGGGVVSWQMLKEVLQSRGRPSLVVHHKSES